ncbi:MAG TPA: hypothetical protein PKC49_07570 [Phycisphaerae bacterium]|nr:hypothetical protein [Phycisphaerae bacterium]
MRLADLTMDDVGAFNQHVVKAGLWGNARPRKRARDILGVLKRMRKRYSAGQRIHLILDNLSAHGTPRCDAGAAIAASA